MDKLLAENTINKLLTEIAWDPKIILKNVMKFMNSHKNNLNSKKN